MEFKEGMEVNHINHGKGIIIDIDKIDTDSVTVEFHDVPSGWVNPLRVSKNCLKVKPLKDFLPYEFMSCEYDDCRARKFAEVEVIKEYDAREEKWIGKHKNITYWFELVNGYAVGLNENPARGMSFPVEKLK